MLHQSVLIRDNLALILLLLCASTNLISATDSTSKKVSDYDVQFKESGTQYTEIIQVNRDKQTELFTVPAHNDVDGSNILHDFKANMSMLMVPDKKICYLLPLSRELPPPSRLESDLDQAEKNSSDEATTIDSKWAVDTEVTNRSTLSEELRNFCPDYPIYRVHTMENTSASEETQAEGAKHRSRRSYWPIYYLRVCPGGRGSLSYSDRSCCSRQPILASRNLAVVFLLLVATANMTSASPVSLTPSPSKKVVDYTVHISESEAQYDETIEVDTEKQTELFKVPAHNKVDQSNILYDFKTNMSMLMLPGKKICYYMPLSAEVPSPTKLESDLDRTKGMTNDRTKTIDSKWTVDSEITDRSVLTEELANFCPEYPIYQVKFLDDSETSTTIDTKGTKHRTRRSSEFPPIAASVLCPGGKSIVTDGDISWCSDLQGCWRKFTIIAGA
ncbi:hypothetical protein AWC38_SpisGene12296 [Stylophora pistillata]|uniref:BRICHOS domain-containing protein n=1 Tax=Stylophora pistillata TaxID=50429 RepID=A0A2B4S155_STYPI|nr:hypothetical protein AWC38_SpisGene12296 [Stylophora pistillata]